MGRGTKILAKNAFGFGTSSSEAALILLKSRGIGIYCSNFSGLSDGARIKPSFLSGIRPILDSAMVLPGRYSAAAASASFGFALAAESMKSEMRGTISDLKREPLKTP